MNFGVSWQENNLHFWISWLYGELYVIGIYNATESRYKAAEQEHKYGWNHTVKESDFSFASCVRL